MLTGIGQALIIIILTTKYTQWTGGANASIKTFCNENDFIFSIMCLYYFMTMELFYGDQLCSKV